MDLKITGKFIQGAAVHKIGAGVGAQINAGRVGKAVKKLRAAEIYALDGAAFDARKAYQKKLRARGYNNFTIRGVQYAGAKRAAAAAAAGLLSSATRAVYLLPKQAEYLIRQIKGGLASRLLSTVKRGPSKGWVIAPKGRRGRKLGGLVRRLNTGRLDATRKRTAALAVVRRRDGRGFVVRERGEFLAHITRRPRYRARLAFVRPVAAAFQKALPRRLRATRRRRVKEVSKAMAGF